ncbi:MAG: helix-turn-helix transcriptional regulator [Pyrinomonadaceae bacterium]|nr:helix-turn-helix transcriptional regulator [Pyrinomonadaceae bacterium]
MLIFNPKRIFALRGVESASGMLARNGFLPSTATRFLQADTSLVKIRSIEKVCVLMNCTPNDLFEWKPDNKTVLAENHPLNTLKREGQMKNLRELLQDMPVEKLAEVENFVNNLKKEETAP